MRKSRLAAVTATIVGIAFVQLANGFLGTLVATSTSALGFAPLVASIVLAAYYAGYTIGALRIGAILKRIGHIRLFAALAGIVAASILAMPIVPAPVAWIASRLFIGFGCAGLFIVAESWLNATSRKDDRGTVFAVYMVASNAAFGIGQFLVNLPSPRGFELFSLAAAVFCIALVPLCMTHSTPPTIPETPPLSLGKLRRLAPTALTGCLASGLITGVFFSLVPAYGQAAGVSLLDISTYIATAVFGGLAFQIPIGRLSDRVDRRLVLAGVALATAACALAIPLIGRGPGIYVLTFLFGGSFQTLYPLSVAHANDRVDPDWATAVSGHLILVNGIAAFTGPILGTLVMGRTGIGGVFTMIAVISGALALVCIVRIIRREGETDKSRDFVILNGGMSQQIAHRAASPDPMASTGGG